MQFFEKVWAKSIDFEFLCENWQKILSYTHNFGVLHFKM